MRDRQHGKKIDGGHAGRGFDGPPRSRMGATTFRLSECQDWMGHQVDVGSGEYRTVAKIEGIEVELYARQKVMERLRLFFLKLGHEPR
jgi:hypothetical protein